MISDDLFSEIETEAHGRYRRYRREMAGRATGQTLNPRDHIEWWIADVALERGGKFTFQDADREVNHVLDATDEEVLRDMRARGECPECHAREMQKLVERATAGGSQREANHE